MDNNAVVDFISQGQRVSLIRGYLLEHEIEDIVLGCMGKLQALQEDMMVVAELDSDALTDIFRFCNTVPFGNVKILIINLSNSSAKNQTSLLKLLEVAFSDVKFILISSTEVLSTLSSRCLVYKVLPLASRFESRKTSVLKVLASTALADKDMLAVGLKEWTDEDSEILKVWACERLSRRFELFSHDETMGLGFGDSFVAALLEALGALDNADSKKTVRSLLTAQIVGR